MSPTSYQTAPPRGEDGYLISANDHSANDGPSAYGPRDIGIPIDLGRSAQKEKPRYSSGFTAKTHLCERQLESVSSSLVSNLENALSCSRQRQSEKVCCEELVDQVMNVTHEQRCDKSHHREIDGRHRPAVA